ncbi:unnamed protein product [Allacma fusca]|uniref:DUF4806 domain-containing protein n=1 Tax=Allacma fusca TaxID=39272 RepID=A0A8J2PI48_9HEXA|nr:unnamed protein product [Allacma fusca]
MIAAYVGMSKPSNIEEYLSPFIIELKTISTEGSLFRGSLGKVNVQKCIFIADAPARAFLKFTVGHTGYYGCEHCVTRGKWNNEVTFPDFHANLRTDESCSSHSQEEHHQSFAVDKKTPLEQINVGLLSQVPIDPMHLVYIDDLAEIRSTRDNFLDTSDIDASFQKNPSRRRSTTAASRQESSDSDSGHNTVPSNVLPEAPEVPFNIPENIPDESTRGRPFLDVNIPLLMVDGVEPITDRSNEQTGMCMQMNKIEELVRKVDEVSRDSKCLNMAGMTSVPTPEGCPKLPVTTFEELQACNSYVLHDENHLQFFMNFVSTVGGVSIKEATERVLSKILTNEVAAGFNWCGTIKTNVKPKNPLKDFEGLLNLLFGSVRKIISTASDKDIETFAKYWLRHAKGRCSGKSPKPISEAALSEGD